MWFSSIRHARWTSSIRASPSDLSGNAIQDVLTECGLLGQIGQQARKVEADQVAGVPQGWRLGSQSTRGFLASIERTAYPISTETAVPGGVA